MKRLLPEQRVSYEIARRRALECLSHVGPLELYVPSAVADHIWPGHGMRGQGAGLAAVAILVRMKKEGFVRWECRERGRFRSFGWKITGAGRRMLEEAA